MQTVVPVADMRSVTFDFLIPDQRRLWQEKPTRILGHIIGHEGHHSILANLKRRGLATELSAGSSFGEAGVSMFGITVQLTEKGQRSVGEVGEAVFSFIEFLKTKSEPEIREHYDEMRRLDDMNFKFESQSEANDAVVFRRGKIGKIQCYRRNSIGEFYRVSETLSDAP
jgi:insulysin